MDEITYGPYKVTASDLSWTIERVDDFDEPVYGKGGIGEAKRWLESYVTEQLQESVEALRALGGIDIEAALRAIVEEYDTRDPVGSGTYRTIVEALGVLIPCCDNCGDALSQHGEPVPCRQCDGRGYSMAGLVRDETCPACKGKGKVSCELTCWDCSSTAVWVEAIGEYQCPRCGDDGSGVVA